MNIDMTRISSRGQIVIPKEIRKGFKVGERLVVIRNNGRLILKKAKDFSNNIEEDIEFAKRTEEAWKAYERGEFIEMDYDEFLDKLKKW